MKILNRKKKMQSDDSEDTRAALSISRWFRTAVIILVVGIFTVSTGLIKMDIDINAAATPVGHELEFVKTGDKVVLDKIAVSPNKKVIAIKYAYDASSRENLSMFGNNYEPISMFKDQGEVPKNYKAQYGMYGTKSNSDGVMILSADEPFQDTAFLLGLYFKKDFRKEMTNEAPINEGAKTMESSDAFTLDERESLKDELIKGPGNDGWSDKKDKDKDDGLSPTVKALRWNSAYLRVNPASPDAVSLSSDDVNYDDIIRTLFIDDRIHDLKTKITDTKKSLSLQKETTSEMKARKDAQPTTENVDKYDTELSSEKTLEDTIKKLESDVKRNEKLVSTEKDLQPLSRVGEVVVSSQMPNAANDLIKN